MIFKRIITSAERFFMHSPFSIVTMVSRIKGNVTGEMLRDAVEKIQQRHILLRVRIQEGQAGELWFTSEGVWDIPIEIIARSSTNDWIKVHAEAARIPFEFETRPAIRFILVQSPETSELIILCHHIICDGMSLAYLARDLMEHLGEPEREVETLPAPAPITLENLPDDVSQSGLAKFLIHRMNRKWAEERVLFDQEEYETLTEAYWEHYHHKVFSIELSEADTSTLVNLCREENVTVNSALTAAFSGAQSLVEGEQAYHSKIVVAASLRDRLPNPPGEGMGMYAGGVELKFKYNHKRGFWENARAFHKITRRKYTNKHLFSDILNWLYLDATIFEAMNFKKLGGLVPPEADHYARLNAFSQRADMAMRLLQRNNIESLDRKHWGTAITNLGRLDFRRTYGPLELDRLIMQPGGGIPLANANLVLGAVTCAGKLSLVLEYAEEAATPGVIQNIKEKAIAYLVGKNIA